MLYICIYCKLFLLTQRDIGDTAGHFPAASIVFVYLTNITNYTPACRFLLLLVPGLFWSKSVSFLPYLLGQLRGYYLRYLVVESSNIGQDLSLFHHSPMQTVYSPSDLIISQDVTNIGYFINLQWKYLLRTLGWKIMSNWGTKPLPCKNSLWKEENMMHSLVLIFLYNICISYSYK